MAERYQFDFREDLPQGAIKNKNYPENWLAFVLLDSLNKDTRNVTGYTKEQFASALSTFPAFIKLAEELGYSLEAPRPEPHTLYLAKKRGEYVVSCGNLEYGKLTRLSPSSLESM